MATSLLRRLGKAPTSLYLDKDQLDAPPFKRSAGVERPVSSSRGQHSRAGGQRRVQERDRLKPFYSMLKEKVKVVYNDMVSSTTSQATTTRRSSSRSMATHRQTCRRVGRGGQGEVRRVKVALPDAPLDAYRGLSRKEIAEREREAKAHLSADLNRCAASHHKQAGTGGLHDGSVTLSQLLPGRVSQRPSAHPVSHSLRPLADLLRGGAAAGQPSFPAALPLTPACPPHRG